MVALTPAGGVDGVALDVLHQRLAEPPTQGFPLTRVVAQLGLGVAGRVGQRQQVPLEHRAHVGRYREPAVAPPVAVVDQCELDTRHGACLLRLEDRFLV
jgi:hypothetical protein